MSLKTTLARIAHPMEQLISWALPRRATGAPRLVAYRGYATPDHLVLQGRILSGAVPSTQENDASAFVNFRRMVRLFMTDEVTGLRVSASGHHSRSDEEGYVRLALPRADLAPGWHDIHVSLEHATETAALVPVRVPSPQARFGVISDIDDTMMQTGAYSLWRNLWTTFTGSVSSRHIFPDAVNFMQMLRPDLNPVFFVSSSPWNLYSFLTAVFERAGLPRAPMFLRDYGVSEDQFITGTHGGHKGSAIDTILAANPDLQFMLIGDTGQHDAHVYLDAARRHPGRIRQVVLREPGPGPDDESVEAMKQLRALGVEVFSGPTFEGVPISRRVPCRKVA